jgi:hypothetical protein
MRSCAAGIGLLVGVLGGAVPASAAEPTLRDAWLSQPLPDTPGLAVMLRRDDQQVLVQRAARLEAELASVALQQRLAGAAERAEGLGAWQAQLAAYRQQPEQARTPGRADLAHWVAHPRLTPRLGSLASFGHCPHPAWVEVWHPAGVTRLPYRPGLQLTEALADAGEALGRPQPPRRLGDYAWLITPLGETHRTGIAAWNHQPTPVAPGSRVLVALADDSPSADWLNQALPAFLATRLPGDDCTLWQVK